MNNDASIPPGRASSAVKPKRVLVVDDHPVFRYGICQLIGGLKDIAVCGEADSGQSALNAMRELMPDLILLDVSMPGTDGIELLKLMLAERPRLLVLMLSMHDESLYALRSLRAGAKGYLMKHQAVDCVVEAIRKVLSGGIYISPQLSERLIFKAVHSSEDNLGSPVDKLSEREFQVLQNLGRGNTTRQVADILQLSVKTIETHRAHIKEKLGFRDAEEMVNFAVEWIAAGES